MLRPVPVLAALCLTWTLLLVAPANAADGFQAGFARVDITPKEPVRLSGYAARTSPMEGADAPIYVRAVAIRHGEAPPHVLLGVDAIGFPGTLSKAVFEALPASIRDDRARFVMAATHSHTAPHIWSALSNLFGDEVPAEQTEATKRYTDFLRDQCIAAAKEALADLKPAKLTVNEGSVGFAKNRRRIQSGVYQGFGEVPAGPVDHAVPVVKIVDLATGKTRGILFNYACHCTTFGPGHNRVNGDWAGYAMANIEAANPGAVAICTIGCGADANPMREGPMQMELSQQQGKSLSDEVASLLGKEGRELTAAPQATFGYAGLPSDRPTMADLEKKLKDPSPQVRKHAEIMIATIQRMGRLPETYPMPIQAWRFGDEFTMVFLGGEVVVDYALRIKQELGHPAALKRTDLKPLDSPLPETKAPVWVTAYANDVFGYVASERVRSEGGYEVDTSMIYYLQPGRWSTGTEEVVMRRVHELLKNSTSDRPLSVNEALKTFTIPDGFELTVAAAEPLVSDPINMAFGADGRLWVVEMGDYPRGVDEKGQPGGKVLVLTDTDGDGKYDKSETFLDGLSFPTGVFPYRDGAFVSCAPDVFFARDTNGDGRADERDVYFTGFKLANPQHRINGFAWGLDGWLYLASGDFSEDVKCLKTGVTINMSGRDMRFDPETGKMETVSGRSQYGRVRNDYGEWFGNNNSTPLFHFPMDDQDLKRNPFVASPKSLVVVGTPVAPVYPTSRTVDRFNDLHTANRTTSGCGAVIVRDARLGADLDGHALYCEPVHNCVSRIMLEPRGVTFEGKRNPVEEHSEFFSSTDNWFRPVKVINAPDGSLLVADMYRQVIEHPEWIPEAWQAQLDVRAGADKGRIYRLRSKAVAAKTLVDLTKLSPTALVGKLRDFNGTTRDLAMQLLLELRPAPLPKPSAPVGERISRLSDGRRLKEALVALNSPDFTPLLPPDAVQEMATRALLEPANVQPLLTELLPTHPRLREEPRVRRAAVNLIGRIELSDPDVRKAVLQAENDPDLRVRLELALVLGNWKSDDATKVLSRLAIKDYADPWMRAAVLSSARGRAPQLLAEFVKSLPAEVGKSNFAAQLTATAVGDDWRNGSTHVLELVASHPASSVEDWQLQELAACLSALSRSKHPVSYLADSTLTAVAPVFDVARKQAADHRTPVERRLLCIALLAQQDINVQQDLSLLSQLLSPREPVAVQRAAIQALTATRANDVASRLLAGWKTQEPAIHVDVMSALLAREEWTMSILDSLESGVIQPSELNAATQARLLAHKSESIRTRAAGLIKPPAARQAVLKDYATVATLKGNANHGAEVFTKTCAACHRLHERGNDVAAKLASLTNKSTDALLTAILDPNQAVEGQYVAYAAATEDGRTFSGMIVEQTATSLTLARTDGKRDTLLRIDIADLASTGKSFMPEGLEKDLSPQDVADVIAFVQAANVP